MYLLEMLIKAGEQLARKGLASKEIDMVMFAMVYSGYSYAEALRAYAEFDGRSRADIERVMDEAARVAGYWTGARPLLDEIYMEAIR